MFGSIRFKNIRLTVFCLICAAVFVAVSLVMLRAGAPDTVEINGEDYSLRAEDEEDIEAFIKACGYDTEGILTDMEITVPKVWNDTYIGYNELQKAQGLDLTQYKGKIAQEYIYACRGGDSCITLIVSDGRIAAAHISATDGSDMRPLINTE